MEGMSCKHFGDLTDGLIYRILSFAYGVTVNGEEILSEKTGKYYCPFKMLFETFSRVSKHCYRCSYGYVHHTPLEVFFEFFFGGDLSILLWACKSRLKIGDLYIGRLRTVLDGNICMHLLQSCNVAELESFNIGHCNIKMHDVSERDRIGARNAGIPVEVLEAVTPPNADYLALLGEYLKSQEPPLKALRLRIEKEAKYIPLWTNFSNTIEDLALEVAGDRNHRKENVGIDEVDDDWARLSRNIKSMPRLKKINIWSFIPGKIHIISKSLEVINVNDSKEGFWISRCECPLLKRISFKYLCNGMALVHPLNRAELEIKIGSSEENETSAFALNRAPMILSHEIHPVIGATIPPSCIIEANITDLTIFKMWSEDSI